MRGRILLFLEIFRVFWRNWVNKKDLYWEKKLNRSLSGWHVTSSIFNIKIIHKYQTMHGSHEEKIHKNNGNHMHNKRTVFNPQYASQNLNMKIIINTRQLLKIWSENCTNTLLSPLRCYIGITHLLETYIFLSNCHYIKCKIYRQTNCGISIDARW